MSVAPPEIGIIQCPKCSHTFPVNLPWLGSTHTDRDGGKISSRQYFLILYKAPYLNDMYECTECGHICTTENIIDKNVKRSDYLLKIGERARKQKFSRMEILEKLLETGDFSKYGEKELLILYWAGVTDFMESMWLNHDLSKRLKEYGGEQKPQNPINANYLIRLLEVLDTKDEKDRLLSIEILRSQERFEEAKKLVDFDFTDEELGMVLEKEIENIDLKNPKSFLAKESPQILY